MDQPRAPARGMPQSLDDLLISDQEKERLRSLAMRLNPDEIGPDGFSMRDHLTGKAEHELRTPPQD